MLVKPNLITGGAGLTHLRWASKPYLGTRRLAAMSDSDLVSSRTAASDNLPPSDTCSSHLCSVHDFSLYAGAVPAGAEYRACHPE